MKLSHLSLRNLLLIVCLAIALLPLSAVTLATWRSAQNMKVASANEYQLIATNIGDKIDRNLFERYGDVQAFGLNTIVTEKDHWYDGRDENPIVTVMNRYVDTYDIYYLTLLVDLDGKLIAANTRDHNGAEVDTSALYEKQFDNEAWFKKAIAGDFYESEDGSFTGTVVEHLYMDSDVASIYGDEGLALGFTAPVKDNEGKTIAVWKNVAKFSLVEEIIQSCYQELDDRGLSCGEITLLDKAGRVIVDCDPQTTGYPEIRRDMAIIGKFNLAEKGVEAAERVVRGESGMLTSSYHARKKIHQVAGYSPLDGALGFPGMQWNVLVRADAKEALAVANNLQTLCLVIFFAAFFVVLGVSYFLSRSIGNVVRRTVDSMKAAAAGDYSVRVQSNVCKDLSELTSSLNSMLDSLESFEHQASDHKGQIAAISKSQAVIEFDLNGIIQSANDNFLNTVGYKLDEIEGQHHRIFVDAQYAQSQEYKHFWERLESGMYNTGEYERIGKDGKEVWIQASYNPICDVNGKPFKVVKYASDITEQVNARRRQEARDRKIAAYQEAEVGRVSAHIGRIASGDLTKNFSVTDCDDDTSTVHNTFVSIATALNDMCESLRQLIGSVANNARGLGVSSSSLSATANQLASGARETTTQSATVASAAEQMATNMRNMANSTEMMTNNVNMVAKSVEELTGSIGEIASTAEQSSAIAGRAAELTQASNETIGELGSAAEEIGKVIEVIQDIAEQTNLLALNATIEAARAGEAGKGFAVVATEVKELARQTAGATEDIRNRIQVIQASTTEAVRSIREVGEVIERVNETSGTIASAVEEQSILTQGIAENVKETADQTSNVSTGVTESATACDEVAKNIVGVDKASRLTSQGANETQSISQSLSDLASELENLVGQFTIEDASAPVAAPVLTDLSATTAVPSA